MRIRDPVLSLLVQKLFVWVHAHNIFESLHCVLIFNMLMITRGTLVSNVTGNKGLFVEDGYEKTVHL